jgi:hypothetical protein
MRSRDWIVVAVLVALTATWVRGQGGQTGVPPRPAAPGATPILDGPPGGGPRVQPQPGP